MKNVTIVFGRAYRFSHPIFLPPSLRSVTFEYYMDSYRWPMVHESLDDELVEPVKRNAGSLQYLRVDVNSFYPTTRLGFAVDRDREKERREFDAADMPRTAAACREAGIFFVLQKNMQ